MKRTGSYRYVYSFSVEYCSIGVANSLDLHKHILKKHHMKYCLDLLKKFIGLLNLRTAGSSGDTLAFNTEGRLTLLTLGFFGEQSAPPL